MAGDKNSPSEIFEHQSSRLKEGLKSCRSVVANYRAMLTESSNDNPVDDVSGHGSEVG